MFHLESALTLANRIPRNEQYESALKFGHGVGVGPQRPGRPARRRRARHRDARRGRASRCRPSGHRRQGWRRSAGTGEGARVRPDDLRRAPAEDGRADAVPADAAAVARHDGHLDDRLRRRAGRGRRRQGRRARLPDEAVRDRRDHAARQRIAEHRALLRELEAARASWPSEGRRGDRRPFAADDAPAGAASTRSRPATRRCCCTARAAPARSWSRAHCTARARARQGPSSRSTARPSPRRCWRPSCSVTSGAPSRAPVEEARWALQAPPNGGTLLLDEMAEMPLPAQAKLLRVLQEGVIEPLGTNESVPVDVRVISATHRNLQGAGRRGPVSRGPVLPAERPRTSTSRRCASAAATCRCWCSHLLREARKDGQRRAPPLAGGVDGAVAVRVPRQRPPAGARHPARAGAGRGQRHRHPAPAARHRARGRRGAGGLTPAPPPGRRAEGVRTRVPAARPGRGGREAHPRPRGQPGLAGRPGPHGIHRAEPDPAADRPAGPGRARLPGQRPDRHGQDGRVPGADPREDRRARPPPAGPDPGPDPRAGPPDRPRVREALATAGAPAPWRSSAASRCSSQQRMLGAGLPGRRSPPRAA